MSRQRRGVFRELAGLLVIILAIDLASINILGTNASRTFDNVSPQIQVVETEQPTDYLEPVLILLGGIGLGIGLIVWGHRASRHCEQEQSRPD